MKNFILNLEYKEVFDMLTDQDAGKLIKLIFEYVNTGKYTKPTNKILEIAFLPIKSMLDINFKKYEEKCNKLKNNINQRWHRQDVASYSGRNYSNDELNSMFQDIDKIKI